MFLSKQHQFQETKVQVNELSMHTSPTGSLPKNSHTKMYTCKLDCNHCMV